MTEKRAEINRIKAVLEEQGRTQTWLAKKLGLTFPTVNGWCNNRNQPYLTDLIRTAELLEVAPADLIVDGTKKEKGLKVLKLSGLSLFSFCGLAAPIRNGGRFNLFTSLAYGQPLCAQNAYGSSL